MTTHQRAQAATYYHRTDAAEAIMAEGFRDAAGSFGLGTLTLRGVWISDEPLDERDGVACGDVLLRLTLPNDLDLSDHEVVEDGKPYREWCVPADLLNRAATITVVDEDAEEER